MNLTPTNRDKNVEWAYSTTDSYGGGQCPPYIMRAAWIAPIDHPPVPDAAIKIENGRMTAIGRINEIPSDGATTIDLPDSILLPGLINAHTHLELSDLHPPDLAGGNFVDWLKSLMSQAPRDETALAGVVTRAISIAVNQCREFGVTTVGDIGRQSHLTRPPACQFTPAHRQLRRSHRHGPAPEPA